MKKKRWLMINVVILVCVFGCACTVSLVNNKNDEEVPINYLVNAINNHDVSEIPNAFI